MNNPNLHDGHALVHTHVVTDDPIHALLSAEGLYATALDLVCEIGTGYKLPDADAYARRLAEQAEAWLQHARERSRMKDETLIRKALHSLAFSFRHRAHDFAIPSKLSGTSKHQKALWQLTRKRVGFGTPLDVEEVTDGSPKGKRVRLVVSYEGESLGEIQSKHVGWLCPLLPEPFGARLFLVRVTGQDRDYTLGLNCCVGGVGSAVTALNHALGHGPNGHGYGGDGAATAPVEAAAVEASPSLAHGGDGATNGLRLVSSAPSVAKPQGDTAHVEADPNDVVCYRDIDGTARATVEHVVRHSPTGIGWGYHGSGPGDLARSVLLAFTDESTADRLYQDFKAEVVAAVPYAGA